MTRVSCMPKSLCLWGAVWWGVCLTAVDGELCTNLLAVTALTDGCELLTGEVEFDCRGPESGFCTQFWRHQEAQWGPQQCFSMQTPHTHGADTQAGLLTVTTQAALCSQVLGSSDCGGDLLKCHFKRRRLDTHCHCTLRRYTNTTHIQSAPHQLQSPTAHAQKQPSMVACLLLKPCMCCGATAHMVTEHAEPSPLAGALPALLGMYSV